MEQDLIDEQPRHAEGVITLVLTADNHLGYAAPGLHHHKRAEFQQRLHRGLQQATDFAIGQGVDLFIQAGDLFDTPAPDEQDRNFVAERLAQLRQAGIRTFALGGFHDTPLPPVRRSSLIDEEVDGDSHYVLPAPQVSYASLGALHYFAPHAGAVELEPVLLDIRGVTIGICGLAMLPGQQGDPLAPVRVQGDIERAAISILILHAPIEGLSSGAPMLDARGQVSLFSIESQSAFRYILAGYHHRYHRLRSGHCDVVVAGATQHLDVRGRSTDINDNHMDSQEEVRHRSLEYENEPGFVFMGLAADGIRWCKHIAVDTLEVRRLILHTNELWPQVPEQGEKTSESYSSSPSPTEIMLERLAPLCNKDALVQVRLEGTLTRSQYHQLHLNQVRQYGEEHCFTLTLDESSLKLLPVDSFATTEKETTSTNEPGQEERLSAREELIAVAGEWIAAATDEREKQAWSATKEELLALMDSR